MLYVMSYVMAVADTMLCLTVNAQQMWTRLELCKSEVLNMHEQHLANNALLRSNSMCLLANLDPHTWTELLASGFMQFTNLNLYLGDRQTTLGELEAAFSTYHVISPERKACVQVHFEERLVVIC